MSIFAKQDAMAEEILTKHRGKALAIVKATRAGATFSLLKKAFELKQKTVIVAPYIQIFDNTVREVADSFSGNKPRIARIPKNDDICSKVAEKIKEHPQLKSLPFHFRPSCTKCKYNNPRLCKLQEILTSDWDVLGLTYAKLRALSISESVTAMDLLKKIKLPDNLILDEFVTGLIVASPSVAIEEPHAHLEKEFSYQERELDAMSKDTIEGLFWPAIANFALATEIEGEKLVEGKFIIYDNPVKEDCETFFQDNFAKCWALIEQLAVEGKNTKTLGQLLQIVTAERFFIIKKDGKISVKPLLNLDDVSRSSVHLKNFIQEFSSESKLVALVDACLPDLDLKENLGLGVESFKWGDPLDTNKSQLIVCDTRKISETDFFKSSKLQPELKDTITHLCDLHGSGTILIATQNKSMHDVLKAWQKSNEIAEDLLITHYRSDISRGITVDPHRRILILIGGPYLPKEAYIPETCTSTGHIKDLRNAYAKSDMNSAFVNMIGRVKDPKGAELSIVYALGVTGEELKAFVSQTDVLPPRVAVFHVQGAQAFDFCTAGRLFLETSRDRWLNLEEDLPVLTKMITKCLAQGEIQCGRIIPHAAKKVQQVAEEYSDILELNGIKVKHASNGFSLMYSDS